MHDLNAWSINLGRWGGVRVRLHSLFLLFAILTIYLATLSGEAQLVWYAAACLGILFVSVLLHEFAHCFCAFRLGGHAEEIVVGPLGGMAQVSVPHEPQAELVTALAGPIVNLAMAFFSAGALIALDGASLLGLLNPIRPTAIVEGAPSVVLLKLTFWLNWLLVIVNLLPAFPFDGGRVLRSVLWQAWGYRTAVLAVARVAKVTAVLLCVAAWLIHDPEGATGVAAAVPPWVPLSSIALLLFFSANHEVAKLDQAEAGDDMFGYDFSQGYTSLERDEEDDSHSEPGFFAQWIERRRNLREQQRLEKERAEEARMDDILARLHESGIDGLSAEDRAILERVSARYRNRQK